MRACTLVCPLALAKLRLHVPREGMNQRLDGSTAVYATCAAAAVGTHACGGDGAVAQRRTMRRRDRLSAALSFKFFKRSGTGMHARCERGVGVSALELAPGGWV